MPDRDPDDDRHVADDPLTDEERAKVMARLELERMRTPDVNTAAIASLILGLSAMACLGLLTGVPALLAGVVGWSRSSGRPGSGRVSSIIGMVTGTIGIAWSSTWLYVNVLASVV